ncbi:MAG TPA: hypothetical protein VHC49_11585 [Mycobacteriales bacterium]|nr:hypothetical protein [Mycobacteriales bacterium]
MSRRTRIARYAAALIIALATAATTTAARSATPDETVGGGSISDPAQAPAPALGTGGSGFVPVKNWNFGQDGTITDTAALDANFQFHDQFGTIDNGGNYGSEIVAPDSASALSGQPVQDPDHPVREFTGDSMKTYLVPLGGATTVTPDQHNTGNGSFQPRWTLPNGGSRLNEDILWETRVRYVTPPYFWFALWTSGNQWNCGAEMDTVESFGFDNGGGFTNYDGHLWHSNSVCGTDDVDYGDWASGMASGGITNFDATQYHVWQWLYRKDNTYAVYVDGAQVQSGTLNWTLGGTADGTPIDMSFLVDAGWGHTQVASVNHSLPASDLAGKYYEFDYSRVYLRQ